MKKWQINQPDMQQVSHILKKTDLKSLVITSYSIHYTKLYDGKSFFIFSNNIAFKTAAM